MNAGMGAKTTLVPIIVGFQDGESWATGGEQSCLRHLRKALGGKVYICIHTYVYAYVYGYIYVTAVFFLLVCFLLVYFSLMNSLDSCYILMGKIRDYIHIPCHL